jgi:starch synthase
MLVPSRFEPCGLTQMEAMAYGAIPVVTGVGGLRDTVIDADRSPSTGTGFVAASPEPGPLVDALHRAARALRTSRRRTAIQRRGMLTDWSWTGPAQAHVDLYASMLGGR